MPPQKTDPQHDQDRYNPAEQDWERTVADDLKAKPEGGPEATDQTRDRLRQSEEGTTSAAAEAAKHGGGLAAREGLPSLYAGTQGAKTAVGGVMSKAAKRWIIGGITSGIVSAAFAIGSFIAGSFVSLKEMALDFWTKNHYSAYSKRTPKLQKRIFQEPDQNCRGIRCRTQGVSNRELRRYERAGWNMEVGERNGRRWIISATMPGDDGRPIRVDANNFERMYTQHLSIRGGSWLVSKPKALVYRAKHAVRKYTTFGIGRSFLIKKASDFRRYMVTGNPQGGRVARGQEDENSRNSEANRALDQMDDSIREAADQQRAALEASNFEERISVRPDLTNLDLDASRAAGVGTGILQGGLRGAVFGVFSALDKACAGYQLLRTVVIGAKIFKYYALIRYALTFMTHADALKAGDANYEEIAFIAGILNRPSTEEDSRGKTAANSNLYSLIAEGGKVQSRKGLAWAVIGTPLLSFFQMAKRGFEEVGANRESCRHVRSWYGQLGLAIAGVAISALTGSGGLWTGVAIGATMGAIISIIAAYVTPILIQFAAGTAAPDPEDPGGGYVAGEAIAAGLGGFASELGKGGLRPLTRGEIEEVGRETQAEMANMYAIERQGKNPFDPTVPNSIANRFALAMAPYVTAPATQASFQNLASLITSPFNLVASSVNQLFAKKATAVSISYGGQYCADDDLREMQVVTDAYCNPVYGEKEEVIDDARYAPEQVLNYMISNGHVNEEDGSIRSGEYEKFIKSCVEGTVPLTPDGGSIDVADTSTDTRLCVRTDERTNMFRAFVMDTNILDGMDASADGSLGL